MGDVQHERPMVSQSSARVLGVDSAGPLGWVGVVLDGDGFLDASVGSLAELIGWAEPVGVIGVDIPIGLVPGGGRLADLAARKFLGAARSTVFAAPPLEVVDLDDYAEANELLSGQGLPKMSRQAWALLPKIRETAAVADADPRVHEVHPEVSFLAMADRKPLNWRKKSWNGVHERRRLLAAEGIEVPARLEQVGAVPADDLLDAAAAAWSACRLRRGAAEPLPSRPEQQIYDGRLIAIWY